VRASFHFLFDADVESVLELGSVLFWFWQSSSPNLVALCGTLRLQRSRQKRAKSSLWEPSASSPFFPTSEGELPRPTKFLPS